MISTIKESHVNDIPRQMFVQVVCFCVKCNTTTYMSDKYQCYRVFHSYMVTMCTGASGLWPLIIILGHLPAPIYLCNQYAGFSSISLIVSIAYVVLKFGVYLATCCICLWFFHTQIWISMAWLLQPFITHSYNFSVSTCNWSVLLFNRPCMVSSKLTLKTLF